MTFHQRIDPPLSFKALGTRSRAGTRDAGPRHKGLVGKTGAKADNVDSGRSQGHATVNGASSEDRDDLQWYLESKHVSVCFSSVLIITGSNNANKRESVHSAKALYLRMLAACWASVPSVP